jgi:hypothetical protein
MNLANKPQQGKRQHCIAAPLSQVKARSTQHVTKLEKISCPTNSLPTCGAHATEQFANVAKEKHQRAVKSIHPAQCHKKRARA